MSDPNEVSIGGMWTTYRRADGELIGGEYGFTVNPETFDDTDEAADVAVEVWQLVRREIVRMGPLGLCSTCRGDGEVCPDPDCAEPPCICPICGGTGEEVRS